jgi:hypothetical protein
MDGSRLRRERVREAARGYWEQADQRHGLVPLRKRNEQRTTFL